MLLLADGSHVLGENCSVLWWCLGGVCNECGVALARNAVQLFVCICEAEGRDYLALPPLLLAKGYTEALQQPFTNINTGYAAPRSGF